MADQHSPAERRSRIRVEVRGQVQGVGFRPFVHRLASGMALGGWVRNAGASVEIEVEGGCAEVERFLRRLRREAPGASRIDHLAHVAITAAGIDEFFFITDSTSAASDSFIAPDSALCAACQAEIFDPRNRRYRQPFTHCTDCGPRYTITARLPYDRVNTSMARFDECPACQAEREQPNQRRFHAQTNACADCGPRLRLTDAAGIELAQPALAGSNLVAPKLVEPGAAELDPGRIEPAKPAVAELELDQPGQVPVGPLEPDLIAATLARLMRGEIVAIKGLGGFHLVCDARNAAAVGRLRARKAREEKPFAVMLASVASVPQLADVGERDAALLASPRRPIVLLPKRPGCDAMLAGVAPDLGALGVMLPSTPIQYLLFHEAAGRPDGVAWLARAQTLALVMTSANPHGEPLVIDNAQALAQLGGIADAFLTHEREILIRCDDSVLLPGGAGFAPQMLRRARGYVPAPIQLGTQGAPGIALGAYLNSTICVTRADAAFLSQHIGDLDKPATCEAFDATVSHLLDILQIEPQWVAADLHPDFYSTRYGRAFAERRQLPFIEVQHHHAHVGAVMAEHQLSGAVLGLALDGTGLGSDGTAWGGEMLRVEGARCERVGRLRSLPLPGGDRAAREPWRMGAAALFELGRSAEIGPRFDAQLAPRFGPNPALLATMLEKGINAPRTSSAGRWFDAAAGLLGVKPVTSFEGQAAIMLEALANRFGAVEPLASGYVIDGATLDLLPLLARLADMRDVGHAAALFHATMAAALAEWVARAAVARDIDRVVLGGGCFHNRILSGALRARLRAGGLRVFEAAQAPPGDGGLSLGQAWVARHAVMSRT